jgi:nitroreductase
LQPWKFVVVTDPAVRAKLRPASYGHPQKNQQQRIAVGGIVQLLQRAQCFNVLFQEFFIPFLRLAKWLNLRWPLGEFKLGSRDARGNSLN